MVSNKNNLVNYKICYTFFFFFIFFVLAVYPVFELMLAYISSNDNVKKGIIPVNTPKINNTIAGIKI
jgi:hypothetical protein